MSNANEVSLAFVEETTFGKVPSGPPTLQEVTFVSEDLDFQEETQESRKIRADRQVAGAGRTSISAVGSITTELTYSEYDEFIAAALQAAAWSAEVDNNYADADFQSLDNSVNSATGDFVTGGYLPNQWVRVKGTTLNDGFYKIVSVATNKMVLTGQVMLDETIAADLKQGEQIVNGSDFRHFSIEKHFTDITTPTPFFEVFLGMAVDSLRLTANTDDFIELQTQFLGQSMESNTATVGDGSNTAPPTNRSINPVSNVLGVFDGGVAIDVTDLTFEITNSLRGRRFIGFLGNKSVGSGKFRVEGSFTTLTSKGTVDRFLNETHAHFALVLEDSDGNGYVFEIPEIRFTAAPTNATGEDTDVVTEASFLAQVDPTESKTLRVARFAA